jgi:LysR family transcriptional regulator, nitrogen assimilation regulatory protein
MHNLYTCAFMNQVTWKLFLEAAELSSMSKLALMHGTSQPQISRQMSALERECGGRLFQRTGLGIMLTELGQRIAPKVRAWLANTELLENEIQGTAATSIGRVRLGIIPSVVNPLASALLLHVGQKYPQVQIQIREGQGSQLQHWLDEGSLDLAILLRGGDTVNANALALAETHTYLVGAKGDVLTKKKDVPFAKLNGLPLVTFCRPSEWRDQLDQHARQKSVRLNVQLEADSLALQIAMVAQGGYYALLGSYAIENAPERESLQISRIIEPTIARHIALATSRVGGMTLAMRTVMDEARSVAKLISTQLRFDLAPLP